MNPSFTRGQYWLLESAVELCLPLSILISENLDEALNKTPHGMPEALLVETLVDLFQCGLIEADGLPGKGADANPEQVSLALHGRFGSEGTVYYGLTAEGGRQWELFARPDWNVIIGECWPPIDEGEFEAITASKHRLERFFHIAQRDVFDVDVSTIQWDTIRPWQATYWRELPLAHRVRCRARIRDDNTLRELAAMRSWYAWGNA